MVGCGDSECEVVGMKLLPCGTQLKISRLAQRTLHGRKFITERNGLPIVTCGIWRKSVKPSSTHEAEQFEFAFARRSPPGKPVALTQLENPLSIRRVQNSERFGGRKIPETNFFFTPFVANFPPSNFNTLCPDSYRVPTVRFTFASHDILRRAGIRSIRTGDQTWRNSMLRWSLHHFNFAGIDRNLSKISLISSLFRSLPSAAFKVAAMACKISSWA